MTDTTSVEANEKPSGEVTAPAVVKQEKPDQSSKADVTEDAKMAEEKAEEPAQEKKPEKEADLSQDKATKKEDKPPPFDSSPRFRKMLRDVKTSRKVANEALELIKKQNEAIEQMRAEQKGEEYKPPKDAPKANFDVLWDELDDSLEELSKKESLSSDQVDEIYAISENYAEDTEDGKVPIRADIAYKIWKDLGNSPKPKKAKREAKPDTKPSKKVEEKNTGKTTADHPKYTNAHHMYADLKRQAAQFDKIS